MPLTQLTDEEWRRVSGDLDNLGGAVIDNVLTPAECAAYRTLFDQKPESFRKIVEMERYRFGSGEYRYLARPYPADLDALRDTLYDRLRPVAVRWWHQLGREAPWPQTLAQWTHQCADVGQEASSVIVLRYQAGDWNALHRDVFGEALFPLQMVINLSDPEHDFDGGEFMLLEQRPRAQSRGTVFRLAQGSGCIFTTRERPVRSSRGWSAAPTKHGVSTITHGVRYTLGIVLHEAT